MRVFIKNSLHLLELLVGIARLVVKGFARADQLPKPHPQHLLPDHHLHRVKVALGFGTGMYSLPL